MSASIEIIGQGVTSPLVTPVVIGASADPPFRLEGVGHATLATITPGEGTLRVRCTGTRTGGVWLVVRAPGVSGVDRRWIGDVDHEILWESVALDCRQRGRGRYVRTAKECRWVGYPWTVLWLSADPDLEPPEEEVGGHWGGAWSGGARDEVTLNQPAALVLSGEPGMTLWLTPSSVPPERGPPSKLKTRRLQGTPLDMQAVRAARDMRELCALLSSDTNHCAVFAEGPAGQVSQAFGRWPLDARWRVRSSDGARAREANLPELLRELIREDAAYLETFGRPSPRPAYYPLLLDPAGDPFALTYAPREHDHMGLAFPLTDKGPPRADDEVIAAAFRRIAGSERVPVPAWNEAHPRMVLAPPQDHPGLASPLLEPSRPVDGDDGPAQVAESLLGRAFDSGLRHGAVITASITVALARGRTDVAGLIARAALACVVLGLRGPTTAEDLALVLHLALLMPSFARPDRVAEIMPTVVDLLGVQEERLPKGEGGWRSWVAGCNQDDRYDAIIYYARLIQRVAPSRKTTTMLRALALAGPLTASVSLAGDHERLLVSPLPTKSGVQSALARFFKPPMSAHFDSVATFARVLHRSVDTEPAFERRLLALRDAIDREAGAGSKAVWQALNDAATLRLPL